MMVLRLLHGNEVHQTSTITRMNRYPKIFAECRTYFEGKKDLTLLSYGCSTGEEVLTLRQYFPEAKIVGADINPYCISVCKKHIVDKDISFIHSAQTELQTYGPYDAIFCMAVLQRNPEQIRKNNIANLEMIYPFEKFEKQIVELHQMLKPNGLFVLKHAQYLFTDTEVAFAYRALGNIVSTYDNYLVFDKNGNRIMDKVKQSAIFIKCVT